MEKDKENLKRTVREVFEAFDSAEESKKSLNVEEVGVINYVGTDIVRARGLKEATFAELIELPGGNKGIAFDLGTEEISVVALDKTELVNAGDSLKRTGRVIDVPVGEAIKGRIMDPLGRPLDNKGDISGEEKLPIERPCPAIMDRAPVKTPLLTGIQAIDALIPIGRGQRELIIGDRQIGKTAIALDTIINQKGKDVFCIYCAIGKKASSVSKLIEDLQEHGAMEYTSVVVSTGEDTAGLRWVAPYAATSMGEFFMEKGRDVLIVYDDLTRHAWAYRELSLLMRRPPAREAYPGDIFYIHSRLLERATHLKKEKGGGSLTALPIIETQAENIAAYIPTNLISITDGQIYLSPGLFQQGVLPAIDIGKSVSRVGGKTQFPSYRDISGDLKLSYSQFKELEAFARFGTQVEEQTRKTIERGRRVQEVLKQKQYGPIPVDEQIAVLLAVTEGLLDEVPLEKISEAKENLRKLFREEKKEIAEKLRSGGELEEGDRESILKTVKKAVENLKEDAGEEQAPPEGPEEEK
ncbi:MAG: alternate F1F0 ATPase, F1 subunit alpha [Candidatus Omnitrophica bacterium]|nr:alternate F1F0 ATPase, F1 subunit alpha [Candidatus Omnitrophota bacterium]